jgi:hypothetical protein
MKRFILLALLLITAIIALEPFGIVMPSKAQMTAAGVLLGLLTLVIGLIWKETPADEREEAELAKRGRYALFFGLIVGSLGLTVNALQHKVNWWLAATVAAMIASKFIRR